MKDYGKGIDQKDFGRIFEPFQQTDTGKENFAGGTGLGLSITKKLVTAMSGNVSVNSEKGSWTTFTVDIPCVDNPVRIDELASKMKLWKLSLVGVLDKEKETISSILRSFDVEVVTFESVNELKDKGTFAEVQHHVLLIQEDAFDMDMCRLLVKETKSTVFTFGTQWIHRCDFVVHHFRSLELILPSVLIRTMIEKVSSKVKSRDGSGDKEQMTFPELRVLVAEDNLVNQKVMAGMLKRLGIKVIDIVDNGMKACEKEEVHVPPYDIILMDQQMPIMGGVDACRRIVNRPCMKKNQPLFS